MTRLTLASVPDSRDETRLKDAWGSNCYIEKDENDALWIIKRPGFAKTYDTPGTVAQGGIIFSPFTGTEPNITDNSVMFTIINDTLYIGTPITPLGGGGGPLGGGGGSVGWDFL